jgi:hypothetical protein
MNDEALHTPHHQFYESVNRMKFEFKSWLSISFIGSQDDEGRLIGYKHLSSGSIENTT